MQLYLKKYIEKQKGKSHRKRVNERLFSNIKDVRNRLTSIDLLVEDEANSLILRLIFIRYLIDRKIKIDDELISGNVDDLNERRKNFIQLIRDPEKLNLLFIKLNDTSKSFLNNENFDWFINNPLHESIEYFRATKNYDGEKNTELFKLIEMGSVISKGDLYNAINQLTD